MGPLYASQLPSLKWLRQGKVRDIYEVDAEHLLIVATDRLSAFDVVLPTPSPRKATFSRRCRISGLRASQALCRTISRPYV